MLELLDSNGNWHKAVALFDSGSDVTLKKRDTAKLLKLDCIPYTLSFAQQKAVTASKILQLFRYGHADVINHFLVLTLQPLNLKNLLIQFLN